jgi:hypothetical protein
MTGAGDRDEGAAREGDAHSLPLASVDTMVPERTTDDTLRGDSGAAVRAGPVTIREGRDDEVARRYAAHLCPDVLYDADELMPDRAKRVRGLASVVLEVGAADAPEQDADDGVVCAVITGSGRSASSMECGPL